MNTQDEKMNFAIAESKHLGQLLQIQNANIKLKLDEEVWSKLNFKSN